MRFATTFLFSALAACILPSACAIQYPRSGSFVQRPGDKVSPPLVIAQRQHRPKRDLIDICISAEAGVLLSPLLAILNPITAHANLCLCVHDLNVFLESDLGVQLGGLLGGTNILEAAATLLLNTSPESHNCHFPPHSHHVCKPDPCAYECDKPYVPGPGKTCVCPPPLTECNGKCGTFPNGCGTSIPHNPKQRRVVRPITTFAEAQTFCQSKTVCGIPGREEETAFECIDTRATLDSCGGCVTPHRFTDVTPSSVKGTDCGHLPGVVSASCSNSRCVITQCREGWHLDANREACVDASYHRATNSSRMKRERRPDVFVANDVVLDSQLAAKLQAYVGLVIDLMSSSAAVPTPPAAGPQPPGPQPAINHTDLVAAVVTTTSNLLNSHTVVDVVTKVNTAVDVNAIVVKALEGCGCSDTLGLGSVVQQLVEITNAALDIQEWCSNHPVGIPAPPPSNPSTDPPEPPVIPNTSNTVITLGLDANLNALLSAATHSHTFLGAGGLGLTGTVDLLLSGLGLESASALDPSTVDGVVELDSELLAKLDILVDLFSTIDLSPATSPATTGTIPLLSIAPTSLTSQSDLWNLVSTACQSTLNLLNSRTVDSLVINAETLVTVGSDIGTILGTCGCADGQDDLVKTLAAIANVTVDIQDWCAHNQVGVPVQLPSGTPNHHPSGSHDAIIVGLDELMIRYLGTDVVAKYFSEARTANSLDNPLGVTAITTAAVISRGATPSAAGTNGDLVVDLALVAQLRTVGNLVLDIKSGSSCLPAAPHNSPPILGTDPIPATPPPVDTNLVDGLVQLTYNLLNSSTDTALLTNLQLLVDANVTVKVALATCEPCAKNSGIAALVKNLEDLLALLLDLQAWCGDHPVVVPTQPPGQPSSLPSAPGPSSTALVPTPTDPSSPSPHPPTGDTHIPIDLGLGDLLASLGLGLNLSANVTALVDLNSLVNTLVNVVVSIQGHSSLLPPPPSPPSSPSSSPQVSPTPRPAPSGSPTPHTHTTLTQGLIDALLQATADLLQSPCEADLVVNVNALLNLTSHLVEGLDTCGCVGNLGLQPLVDDTNELLDAVLAISVWGQQHSGTGEPPVPVSGGGSGGGQGSPSSIIIDAKPLLSALGLGDVVQLNGEIGGLGDAAVVGRALKMSEYFLSPCYLNHVF
ncbi:hypothetical protein LshimejAT787_0902470 [Lyophyllum shimeji]|uniref:Protein CPL1-like domain-containing protein n=1 Tax=Lyophyllum shimeji TaxID=47721 RepID=A0A9P3PQW0_LYOSH|nr:hypothetical protein LshimejAT787_0902470 [Lyophyllum shimeji]